MLCVFLQPHQTATSTCAHTFPLIQPNSLRLSVSAENSPHSHSSHRAPHTTVKLEIHEAITKAKSRVADAAGCRRLRLSDHAFPDTEAVSSAFSANPIKLHPQVRTGTFVDPTFALGVSYFNSNAGYSMARHSGRTTPAFRLPDNLTSMCMS